MQEPSPTAPAPRWYGVAIPLLLAALAAVMIIAAATA